MYVPLNNPINILKVRCLLNHNELNTHFEVGMASTPLADPEAELGHCEVSVEGPDDPPVQGMAVHQELDLSTAYRHRHFVPLVVCKPKRKSLHLRRCLMLNLVVESDLILPATRLQFQVPVNTIRIRYIYDIEKDRHLRGRP